MTRNEILNMPAGREIEILVSEKIFNKPRITKCNYCNSQIDRFNTSQCEVCYADNPEIPHYSLDVEAAWEVVEKLCDETGCDIVKMCKRDPELYGAWSCNFGRGFDAFGDTAPLAICRAALLSTLEDE